MNNPLPTNPTPATQIKESSIDASVGLVLRDISIRLKDQTLIDQLSIAIKPGEIITLMGSSGSGKSTLLNYIGGYLDPIFKAEGDIFLHGLAINDLPPERRSIGILFQDDILFPHLSVGQNLAFGIPSHYQKERRIELVHQALRDCQLENHYHSDPATLSGGQRARISLMRQLLAEPKAILLDEPFSKLDIKLRQSFRDFVSAYIEKYNLSSLLVTHDPEDAKSLSQRIIELKEVTI